MSTPEPILRLPRYLPGTAAAPVAVKETGKDTIPLAAVRSEEPTVTLLVADENGKIVGRETVPSSDSYREDPAEPGLPLPQHPNPLWDGLGGIGFQSCTACKAVHTDGDALGAERILQRLWASALAAGWRQTDEGLLCPDCAASLPAGDTRPAPAADAGPDAYRQWVAARKEARDRVRTFDAGLDEHDKDAEELVRARLDDFRARFGIPKLEEVPS